MLEFILHDWGRKSFTGWLFGHVTTKVVLHLLWGQTRAAPVNTGPAGLQCSHSNPSPWGALCTHFLSCPSWCPGAEAGEPVAGRSTASANLVSWGQWWYQTWNSPSSVWELLKPVSSPICFPDRMKRQCTFWTHIWRDTMLTISPRAATAAQWFWGFPENC